MRNGNFLKSCVSEICVKRIRVIQGVGVHCLWNQNQFSLSYKIWFLSSLSACRTSGASKNRDYCKNGGHFPLLLCSWVIFPKYWFLGVPWGSLGFLDFLMNFLDKIFDEFFDKIIWRIDEFFWQNFLTNLLMNFFTNFFTNFFDEFFDEFFWRIFLRILIILKIYFHL